MKILKSKGYVYKKYLSTGGEGEVHLIKLADTELIAKIFPKLKKDSIEILNTIKDLDIDGIPKIHEIFDYEDKTILIRDFAPGTTLYDEIKKNECLSFKRSKTIISKICKALKGLHNAKPKPIIYRDLKPENIIVTPEGNIHLIDFGIARYYKIESTRDTVLAGTRGYTAPEVMAGMQSDIRSDVYSVGLLFYEMLTGKNLFVPPFQIRPVRETNEYLPEWLDKIIEKATDLNQTNRYKTTDEFIDAIENPVIEKKSKVILTLIKKIIIASVLSIIAIGGIFLISKVINNIEKSTDVISSSLPTNNLSQESETYNTLLDLEFNEKTDADWLETMGQNAESIIARDCIENGVFTLKEEIQLKQSLTSGKFIHIQMIAPDFDKTGSIFMVDLSNNNWNNDTNLQFIRLYFENNQPLRFDVQKHSTFANVNQSDTAMLMRGNMRVDIIVWLNESDNSLRYIIFDANDENSICYMGITFDDALLNQTWGINLAIDTGFWGGAVSDEKLYTDIEFMKVASGSIRMYLKDNISAYEIQKEKLDSFFVKDMPKINELYYMGYNE